VLLSLFSFLFIPTLLFSYVYGLFKARSCCFVGFLLLCFIAPSNLLFCVVIAIVCDVFVCAIQCISLLAVFFFFWHTHSLSLDPFEFS
jgi:hypothetical protein